MKEKFKILLDRFHHGECSEEELQEMLDYLDRDPHLYQLLDQHVDRMWELYALRQKVHKERVEMRKRPRSFMRTRVWVVAASLLVLVVAGWGIWKWASVDSFIVYETDFGERKDIKLPDGSLVELNANTRLSWNKNWNRTGMRSVDLEGEAFFEVVKSKASQFKVNSDGVSVNVLGTSFNVSNRRGKTEVFLEKGAVKIELMEREEVIDMKPGEKIWYDPGHEALVGKLADETLHSAAAWKMGVISYQKTPLKDILPELSDIYGIRIVCEDTSLEEKVMDIGVPYMDWEATKHSLELAMKVKIEQEGEVYIIKGKNN